MKKLAFVLAVWMLLSSPATSGNVYIVGPNDRGEGPLPPATGMTLETKGLFFVDVYAEDMAGFAGFQATLQFLDEALVDAGHTTIYVAYNNTTPEPGAPWGDRQITWNTTFMPNITKVLAGQTFGLLSAEREWDPDPPPGDWGDYIDKSITDKVWLMTVGYWYIPGAEGDGSTTYTINMEAATSVFGDAEAQAIDYTLIPGSVTIGGSVTHDLNVQSTPITGVDITGDKPGATDYSATCDDQEVVDLAAPPAVTVGAVRYDFVRWNVGGADQPAGQTDVQVTMDADVTATASYALRTHTLSVLSTPVSGVDITGDKPGATDYAATCDDQEIVSLSAPLAATIGGAHYDFIRWSIDGAGQADGQTDVQVTMDADVSATAAYQVQTYTLTVLSMPIKGVDVTGDKPGATPYAAACDDQQLVTITATAAMAGGSGKGYNFLYWIVDDETQPYGQAELQLTMDADHTGIAIYDWRLDADTNDDCIVNVLDMLYVRNRLNGSR